MTASHQTEAGEQAESIVRRQMSHIGLANADVCRHNGAAMPANDRDKLSAAEIAVMKAVWRSDSATVPAILDAVNAQREGEAVTRGTIHVLLTRLEEKGWLAREKDGRGFVYRGTVGETAGMAEIAGEFRETVFDGSSLALVQCLARGGKIKPKEVASLRLLLDELEAGQTRSKPKP